MKIKLTALLCCCSILLFSLGKRLEAQTLVALETDYVNGSVVSYLDPSQSQLLEIDAWKDTNLNPVNLDLSGDIYLRSFEDKLFILDRSLSLLHVVNPKTQTVYQQNIDLGPGCNPQDVNYVSNSEVYVTQFGGSSSCPVGQLIKLDLNLSLIHI